MANNVEQLICIQNSTTHYEIDSLMRKIKVLRQEMDLPDNVEGNMHGALTVVEKEVLVMAERASSNSTHSSLSNWNSLDFPNGGDNYKTM